MRTHLDKRAKCRIAAAKCNTGDCEPDVCGKKCHALRRLWLKRLCVGIVEDPIVTQQRTYASQDTF